MSNGNFDAWFKQVDEHLIAHIGLGAYDLRDRLWYDAYDDGLTPEEAVEDLCGDVNDPESFLENELFS